MKPRHNHAFTLVEMLTVMAVMTILITLVAPAATSILRGNNLTQSGEMVSDQIVLARQAALTGNRPVQVRFYQLPVPSADNSGFNYCAIQCFRTEQNGKVTPLTKLQALRTNVVFAPDFKHSTILAPPTSVATIIGKEKLPSYSIGSYSSQEWNYVGFQFLSNGSTDLDPTNQEVVGAGGWFITMVEANVKMPTDRPPTNFYTLRVEPLDGHVRLFRP